MSVWKQREAIVVIFNLKRWFFSSPTAVTGIIYNSTNNKEYLEDTEMTFMNIKSQHYPKSEKYGEGHFIITSQTGTCFRLNGSEHL